MAILQLIQGLLSIYQLILLGRVLLSWFPTIDRYNPIVKFLYDVTEPVLAPIREMLPAQQMGGMDFSPIVVFMGIWVLLTIIPG